MHLITYTSQYAGSEDSLNEELKSIERSAKRKNPSLAVTGVLFHLEGSFIQVLEGEKKQLEGLMSIIEKDTRHENIQRIIDVEVTSRKLKDWNMDTFDLAKGVVIEPKLLIAIKEAFEENFFIESELIMHFYKDMLSQGIINLE